VLEEMTAAAAACAAVGARNPSGGRPDWEQEVIAAKELLAKVTPPHRSRPERRRGEREERKAAAKVSRTSERHGIKGC
jgi:hypothetical protein